MKKNKVVIVVVGIIVAIAVLIGVGFVFTKANSNKSKKEEPIQTSSEKEQNNITVNEIKEEHCYQDLCTNSFVVAFINQEQGGNVNFKLTNKGNMTIPETTMKIVFDNGIEKEFTFNTLEAQNEVGITFNYDKEELKNVKNYEILPINLK